jgi:nicotinate-nucleotide pyrophosphorylase (carboxylating)
MDDATLASITDRFRGRCLLEASGGLDLERLHRLAATGADVASMGGLIHPARWADVSLKVVPGHP